MNIRSLNSCFDDFSALATEQQFDVIAVSETWLTPNDPSEMYSIPEYNLLRCDRPTRGGGVCWYVKKNIMHNSINTGYISDGQFEQLWITITLNNRKLALGVGYRPPQCNLQCLNNLEEVLSDTCGLVDEIIFVGDLNIDFYKEDTPQYKYIKNILDCFDLKQHINEPTRISGNSSTLIDIICTNTKDRVIDCGTLDILNMSDHRLTYCKLDIKVMKNPRRKVTYRDYSFFDSNEFAKDASSVNWNYINTLTHIDDKVDFLNRAIITLFDIHAPYRTVTVKHPPRPYITDTIKQMIKLKDRAYNKYKKNKLENHLHMYKDLKNYLSLAIKNEKKAYISHQININRNDPKKLWRDFAKWNVHNKPLNEICPAIDNPDEINRFFTNIKAGTINNETLNYYLTNLAESAATQMNLPLVSVEEVEKTLAEIKSFAFGSDNINLKMLRYVFPFCKGIITHIINTSFECAVIPSIWKKSIVTPLPKVSLAVELKDLRPISVLPPLSKLLEKIMSKRLTDHVNNNNILPSIQSGFRKHHNTTTALIKVTNDIMQNVDKSQSTFLVLLDYSKAFDVINHELLIAKLHHYNIHPVVLAWFSNYLSNRVQTVKLNNSLSTDMFISKGVPQGSILGPLLFTIYTSDLPSVLTSSCTMHLYADDAQLQVASNPQYPNLSIMELNENLRKVSEYSKNHGMVINPSKTVALCIGNKVICAKTIQNMTCDIVLDNNNISLSDSAKNLGVIIDQYLNFEKHVLNKCCLGYSKIKYINKYKYILSSDIKWRLVDSLILSHFDYASSVYFNFLSKSFQNRIQVMQNCCLRFSFNLDRRNHITPFYIERNILKIESRFIFLNATLLYNVVANNIPQYLFGLLERRSNIHNANLRYIDRYSIPKHNTSKFESCFSYTAPKLFNMHCNVFNSSISVSQFKSKFKKELLDKQKCLL